MESVFLVGRAEEDICPLEIVTTRDYEGEEDLIQIHRERPVQDLLQRDQSGLGVSKSLRIARFLRPTKCN